MDVELRPARPDQSEAETHTGYLDTAADDLFHAMLGKATARVIAEVSLHPGTELSWEHVTVAEAGEQVVGMRSGFARLQEDVTKTLRTAGIRSLRVAVVAILA